MFCWPSSSRSSRSLLRTEMVCKYCQKQEINAWIDRQIMKVDHKDKYYNSFCQVLTFEVRFIQISDTEVSTFLSFLYILIVTRKQDWKTVSGKSWFGILPLVGNVPLIINETCIVLPFWVVCRMLRNSSLNAYF